MVRHSPFLPCTVRTDVHTAPNAGDERAPSLLRVADWSAHREASSACVKLVSAGYVYGNHVTHHSATR